MKKENIKNQNIEEYGDDSILTKDPIEHIRLRPGMYGGALHQIVTHCIREIIDNSIDEVMNGYADTIKVNINTKKNECTIEDNGRGIPIGISEGKPTIQRVFMDINTGGKFDNNAFKNSGGLNGVGLKLCTALCEFIHAESERNGNRVSIEFSKGKLLTEYKKIKSKGINGTLVTFRPDSELFKENDYYKINIEQIKEVCKFRALLNKGLNVELTIDKNPLIQYKYDKGMIEYFEETIETPLYNMEPFMFEKTTENSNWYEVTMCYNASNLNENIISYCNGIKNSNGGTHEFGFKESLTRITNKFILDNNLLPKKHANLKINGEDIRKGLNVVLNCKVKDPLYEAQTKNSISNPEVRKDLNSVMNELFKKWVDDNTELFKKICNRIVQFALATENIKKAQEKIVKNSSSSSLNFSDKYIDCISKDPSKRELFICEGKSAGGSISDGRDGDYQAVYMLRGKPLNAYGVQHSTLISNFEFNELMQIIFGTNSIKDIDYSKVSFDKIIFMADADDDGMHIISLLSMAFKEHFNQLIDDGKVYVGCPPKYSIVNKGKYIYFKNDYEFNKYKAKYVSERYKIKTKGIKMFDIVNKIDLFTIEFNRIKNKYGLDNELLSSFMSKGIDKTAEELSDELEVLYNEELNIYNIQGLYDDNWLDLTIDDEFIDNIKFLIDIYGISSLIIEDIKENEIFEGDIWDIIQLINDSFKFHRNRFKGLGESDSDELSETALDPATRDIIKISISDLDKANNLTKILFHSNSDPRKEFIQKNLLNWNEEE